MEKDGVIERVSSATSAAPIVNVGKKDGDEVRVCGDFNVTYNSCANVEIYPMPKIEDMHSALRGCTVFSVLDLPIIKPIIKFLFRRIPRSILLSTPIWACLLLKDYLMAFIQVQLYFRELWMGYWLIFQKLLVDWMTFLLLELIIKIILTLCHKF